ncbi:WD and tetratricopeptide repeats protein 1 [Frankliniella fusca]|uniref:WD and tetratricopeptide repeats protein 1 n=1 Tax=Frankliniella fusca TaxID=407009 RepID=A0AAE1HK86_9NEOP|nr:WD and tetratricopeptide repeats protein 1 [Frankliniella fusca]
MASNDDLLHLLKKREIDDKIARKVQSRLHVTEELIHRLGLEKELEGHTGCVNCLEWNSTGELLASASDDFHIIVWDPFRHKALHTLSTNHHGNIFSVKFMPKTNDSVVISGAADYMINVHDITLRETIRVCTCHTSRVKRLAVCPETPSLFWSSSEDGTIRQFDQRVPHICRNESDNVLIHLKHCFGRLAEAKCLAVNPVRPELLAVGANDAFVRLYDRRMIRPTTMPKTYHLLFENGNDLTKTDHLPDGCAEYFVAGHLNRDPGHRKLRSLASTYVTFGANGRDLLVNLGGEQIYLFDIYNKTTAQFFDFKSSPYFHDGAGTSSSECCINKSNGSRNGYRNGISASNRWIHTMIDEANPDPFTSRPPLPPRVESLRLKANNAFENLDYPTAVRLYNEAISMCSESAVLFGNRAAALMKRDWDGDVYAALRDCQKTLELEPNHYKAHFRMIRCLHELHWTATASDCLKVFKNKYPSHAQNTACRALERDIDTAASKIKATEEDSAKTEKSEAGRPMLWDLFRLFRSPLEQKWQENALDYEKRFCGHCNTTTDIKEANFFGEDGQFIVAGSDDGSMFIWERNTTNNIRILKGDASIVNCLQPHPTYCLLATSGIDPVVRLWSPLPEDGRTDDREVSNKDVAAKENQKRMKADPFDFVLMNYMGYNPDQVQPDPNGDDDDDDFMSRVPPDCSCRPS